MGWLEDVVGIITDEIAEILLCGNSTSDNTTANTAES